MKISVETMIDATPQVVFATVADVARWQQFISAIERIDILTPLPVAVGTRVRETRKMFGRSATEEMTISEMDAPHRLVLTTAAHGANYRKEHLIEASTAGGRLRLTFEARPVGLFARLMAPIGWLFLRSLKGTLVSDLDDLKREAERRQPRG